MTMSVRKITQEQAREIRASSLKFRELAQLYGLSVWSINQIRQGYIYREPGQPMPTRLKHKRRKHFRTECHCGCKAMTAPGKRFIAGHSSRVNDVRKHLTNHQTPLTDAEFLSRTWDNCKEEMHIDTPCLIWQGTLQPKTGYSICSRMNHNTTRHRVIWQILHPGVVLTHRDHVHHHCQQRACQAPWHLTLLTARDHIALHTSPVNDDEVAWMREMKNAAVPLAEICACFPDLHKFSVRNITLGHRRGKLTQVHTPNTATASA